MSTQGASANELTLFLDFDGVLHPLWEPGLPAYPYQGPKLVSAPILADLLAPYLLRLDVVISSLWQCNRTLAELRSLLPAALAARIGDVTRREHYALDYRPKLSSRYGEIWLYVNRSDRASGIGSLRTMTMPGGHCKDAVT